MIRGSVWIGLLALVALIAGIGVAARQWAPPPAPSPAAPRPSADADTAVAGDEDVVARALEAAQPDSLRWVDDVPHVELAGIDAPRRELFLRHANTQACGCGCGYTLAGCRVYDPSCEKSGPRIEALLDSVRQGWITQAGGTRPPPGSAAAR